jgi:hypothetical protein
MGEGGSMQSFDVLANDTDGDDDTLTLDTATVLSTSGIAAVSGGEIDFTPAALFLGNAAITYTMSDGHGHSDTGMLNVTVSEDVLAPVISSFTVTIGAASLVTRAPLRVSWAATDAGSGVASYQVQVSTDGGAFVAFYAGSGLTRTALFTASHGYVFRVRATDVAGNVSGYETSGSRNPLFVQSRNTHILYRPSMWTYVSSSNGSPDGVRYSTTKGAAVSYLFTGREIVWVAPKNSRAGTAYVYIDGVKKATVNLYSATGRNGQQVFKQVFLTSGRHTIKIVVASSGKRVGVDAFLILR